MLLRGDRTMTTAYYEIQVKNVTENGDTYAVAELPKELKVGKTVHYSTTGKPGDRGSLVTIRFNGKSPYMNADGTENKVITSKDGPVTLAKTGDFLGQCSIQTKHNGKVSHTTYDPHSTVPGGNHKVV
jgi:hypothetical protein